MIGYSWSFAQSDRRTIVQGAIHPDWRRQGVGARLLALHINKLAVSEEQQIVSGARANNPAAIAFLESKGFQPVGNNRFFKSSGDLQINKPAWLDGFTVKSCEELGSLHWIVEGSNACYSDMWGHRENIEPLTIDYVEELQAKYPDLYDPAGIFIIFDQVNKLAGICFCRIQGPNKTKIIDSPGVIPTYRHLDLWRPLIQNSMLWLNQQADGDFHLNTFGDFDSAVKVYLDMGFELSPENHLIEYLLHR